MKNSLPIIAIVISIISLTVSVYLAWRDRASLKTKSNVYKHEETDEFSVIHVKAVNTGRRPIILRSLMGKYEEDDISGYQLDNQGIKLEENEFYETRIGKFDGMMMYMGQHGEKTSGLIDLFFEDSKGKQYIIKDAKVFSYRYFYVLSFRN